MYLITLDSDTDFDGWRTAARALAINDVKPADINWRVQGHAADLFEELPSQPLPGAWRGR